MKPATSSASILQLNSTQDIYAASGVVSTDGITSPVIYVNGNQNGTLKANNWNHIEVTTPNGMIATTPILGKLWRGVLNGFIDDVKLYPYARTAQVLTDYNARGSVKGASVNIGIPPNSNFSALNQGLVGYWKMDEATWSGTLGEVVDSSGNGNNGTAACSGTGCGKAYSGSPSKFGNAGQFEG